MSGEEYIKLPNGKKIYLKKEYGNVEFEKVPRGNLRKVFNVFNDFQSDKTLSSKQLGNIFNALKVFATQDGNNELSTTELLGFIKEHCPDDSYCDIQPKEVMQFLEILQKESEKSIKNPVPVTVRNSVQEIFPELAFLNLGPDNNIDTSKLNFDEIAKLYPSDKYEIIDEDEILYHVDTGETKLLTYTPPESGQSFTTSITHIKKIINKESGKEVLIENFNNDSENNITIVDETSGRTIGLKHYKNSNTYNLLINDKTNIAITDNMVSVAKNGENSYYFDEGILSVMDNKNSVTYYRNGEIDRVENFKQDDNYNDISETLVSMLGADNIDIEAFSSLINNSVQAKEIGFNMDNYFALTGRELIDDIKASNLPEKAKKEILKSICTPFNNSSYYDADKKVESSRISNKYYTSPDEYSIEYNGPIINVLNKTTGKTHRINLKTLMKDMDFPSKSKLKRSLKALQNYPGEILENMAIELKHFQTMTKEDSYDDYTKFRAGAFYCDDTITTPHLGMFKGGVIVHELAHGIDDVSGIDAPTLSATGKFKEVFDRCIKRYEESGHKRFDDQKSFNFFTSYAQMFTMSNYATYNEQEAFAISMQILMGYEDAHAKFIKKYMPELIDAAREQYLEIRQMDPERRRNN